MYLLFYKKGSRFRYRDDIMTRVYRTGNDSTSHRGGSYMRFLGSYRECKKTVGLNMIRLASIRAFGTYRFGDVAARAQSSLANHVVTPQHSIKHGRKRGPCPNSRRQAALDKCACMLKAAYSVTLNIFRKKKILFKSFAKVE